MRMIISMAACILFQTALWAQKPEPVKSFATVLLPVSWYKEQASLWKKEIDKDPKNAAAWYNYYRAHRSLNRLDTTDKRNAAQKYEQEKQLVEEMEKAIPDSYEYNLCRWLIEGNKADYIPYLKRAAELGEGHMEHYSDMIVWGEMERNQERKDLYSREWYQSGTASPGLLYYNYNVLAGLKPNAIIFTAGDNDTYPIWMLQAMGIRKDVTVLNTSLLMMDEYREKIFKELGVKKWTMTPEPVKKNDRGLADDVDFSDNPWTRFEQEIVKHVAANTKGFPVYVGLTVSDSYTKSIPDELYLTGLAYEYCTRPVDNIALLRKNFEQLYALDYLDKSFFTDVSQMWVKRTNYNYVVPMIKLYDHYKASGDHTKAGLIKSRVQGIVKGMSVEKETMDYFNKN